MTEGKRDDRGQISVMIIGFFLVLLLVVAVVVNASAAYLGQRRLADLADGAALAAAEGVERSSLYGATGERAPLDPTAARTAVADYLRAVDADGHVAALRWEVRGRGDAVVVRLEGRVRLPLVPPGWTRGAAISADATVELRID
ncbi:pilus assembly protein TadG-related protein [Mumia sp. ZJ430]|uniref:pilus assembly protein TadG-related protein n=1 Tax=Mumia sp. ZJ430 TaxID=2708083 RepID=UPI00141EA75C|nr:pilus assembly protein TadG-related protein [Mumia sp. ZJ430]